MRLHEKVKYILKNIPHHIQFLHQRSRSLAVVYGEDSLEHATIGLKILINFVEVV